MVRRFVEGRFSESYLSTIGVRVSRRILTLPLDPPCELTLMVWDTAGGEPFSRVLQSYYRGASGALLVCDLTRGDTAGTLGRYADDFGAVNPGAPLVIVGNKVDLIEQRVVADEQIAAFATTYAAPWFLASAKTGEQVEAAFESLGRSLL